MTNKNNLISQIVPYLGMTQCWEISFAIYSFPGFNEKYEVKMHYITSYLKCTMLPGAETQSLTVHCIGFDLVIVV